MYRLELDETGEPAGEPQLFQSSSRADYLWNCSPDGKKVVFSSNRNGPMELFVCDWDGSNLMRLIPRDALLPATGSTYGVEMWRARWSPDGRWIAFAAMVEGQFGIYRVRPEGGMPQRLAEGGDPTWSPDGKWVYFSSTREGKLALLKVPAEGGQIEEAEGRELGQSPDGEWRYLTNAQGTSV
ncbi:MAG: PD40 domain-containing protein [Acidobacteriota bacterium]|nr:MAG: PD40 domain-containing protein [Acidobacteriota bacterium]